MRDLTTYELVEWALDIVKTVRLLDISEIQQEMILLLALDRLRAERYYRMFLPEPPEEMRP